VEAAWLGDTQGLTPATLAALYRAKYLVGEAVARVTGTALTQGGAHALIETFPLERLFRDKASAPIMLPSSDACLATLGIIGLGLDAHGALRALKGQWEDTAVPGIRSEAALSAVLWHNNV
jgi:alkylation response protein AidB-like acyl-CoA dehydrogenase